MSAFRNTCSWQASSWRRPTRAADFSGVSKLPLYVNFAIFNCEPGPRLGCLRWSIAPWPNSCSATAGPRLRLSAGDEARAVLGLCTLLLAATFAWATGLCMASSIGRSSTSCLCWPGCRRWSLGALAIPSIRRAVIIEPAYAAVRKILPKVSETEQQALDAGTIGFDAEIFGGRPDWAKLRAIPGIELTEEERAFLNGPTEELCRMCDDWKIRHDQQGDPRRRSGPSSRSTASSACSSRRSMAASGSRRRRSRSSSARSPRDRRMSVRSSWCRTRLGRAN